MRHTLRPALLALAALVATPAAARAHIELVTLPPRDTVQLTIYNSADLTLVRERRNLTLRKGENRLQFSWAGTLIDPTSVEIKAVTHPHEVEVLDTTFPANLPNNLVWHLSSEVEGDVQVEMMYFTSGISWSADYTIEADDGEGSMTLGGYVTVHNRSGEDYPNAETRLVVGKINLVEDIAGLATGRAEEMKAMRRAVMEAETRYFAGDAAAPAAPKEIIKEGLSEYFLYTVEGRETIPDTWSKRLRSFIVEDVPLQVEYRVDPHKWGDAVHKFFTVTNAEENELGKEPLPNGRVMAFRRLAGSDRFAFAGQGRVEYVPVGEDIEVDLGILPNVSFEAKRMQYRKENVRFDNAGNVEGFDTIETFLLKLRNGTARPAKWEVRRRHHGDWSFEGDAAIARENVTALLTKPTVGAGELLELTYVVTTVVGRRGVPGIRR